MPWALAIGPAAALIGIAAVFFVLRRKSVDKRSMYSARRSQIEHKVRAARQRTLAPHGRADKQEGPPAPSVGASPFAAQAPGATYEVSAYEPPPAAPAPAVRGAPEAPSSSPWDVGATVPPPGQFEAPPGPPPAFEPAPVEEVWTPAPAPAPAQPEPLTPLEPIRPAAAAASPAAWSVVAEAKGSAAVGEPEKKKKKKGRDQEAAPAGSWALASGNTPGMESDEGDALFKAPGQAVAIAQYAVLVVGLVAVLIGVLIMVAGSPVR
ncbi:MAG TPA: hypothetical protein VGE99_06675 [Candidatus Dormibacteraeota bacterium]